MHTNGYYIKSLILSVMIFVEAFMLSQLIITFVRQHSIFSVSIEYSIAIVVTMLILLWTVSLTVGGWGKWAQYVILTVPTALALFITTMDYSLIYAPVVTILAVVLLMFDIERSSRLRNLMIKFEPAIILRFSTRGLLFIFSVLGGLLFFINSVQQQTLNIGKQVAQYAEIPIKKAIENQIKEQTQEGLGSLVLNEELTSRLEAIGVTDPYNLAITESPIEGLNLKDTIEDQVNGFLEPYKSFLTPLMAILTFTLFQFYASIAFFIYTLTVKPLFFMAEKLGIFRKEIISVEKEVLRF